MQRLGAVLVFVLALAGTVFPPVVASLSSADPRKNVTSDRWAADNYRRAVDVVFQDPCAAATDARWIACIRILPPFRSELEYSLSVHKQLDGTITARIARPKLHSIYDQLRQRKRENMQAPLRELLKLIEVESQEGDQHRFPTLVDLAKEFEDLRVSPVLSDEIMMDPTEYRFHVRSSSGENIVITLDGPGSAGTVQPSGLIQWAESIRGMLAAAFK